MVAFVFEFNSPISDSYIDFIEARHQGEEDELPGVVKHSEVAFSIGPGGVQHSVPAAAHRGVTFQCVANTGEIEWGYTVEANRVLIRCAKYDCWINVFGKVKGLMERFMEPLFEANSLATVGLEYRDEFLISDIAQPWVDQLFDRDSKHLSPNIFEMPGLWHSHSGYYVYPEIEEGKLLNRLNIDHLVQDSGEYIVSMVTQHRIALTEPTREQLGASNNEQLLKLFDDVMHLQNKELLKDLLSSEMKEKIGLKDS